MLQFYLKKLFPIVLLLIFQNVIVIYAQEDCSFTLTKAQKLFDAGVIENIPQMLQPCIENGFTKEDKLQAQKLIILSYLFNNNIQEAEKAMLNFLHNNPEYEIQPADQAEFVQLFNTYRTLPIFTIGIKAGLNNSYIWQQSDFYTTNSKNENGTYKSTGTNFQFGISLTRFISEKFDINLETYYIQNGFVYNNPHLTETNSLNYTETQTRIEVPLTTICTPVKYKKFSPYLRAGLSFSYLLSSTVSAITTNLTDIGNPNTGPNYSIKENRNPKQIFGIVGGGISYSLKRNNLFIELRYNFGLQNQVNNSNRFGLYDQLFHNLYEENDFHLSNLWFSIGWSYKFFKPEKKKNK